jgi:hypothetical protein
MAFHFVCRVHSLVGSTPPDDRANAIAPSQNAEDADAIPQVRR